MKNTDTLRGKTGRIPALLAALFGASACAAAVDSEAESFAGAAEVDTVSQDITGGWTLLPLNSGWASYHSGSGKEPAVGIVNGIVTFRGAIKAVSTTAANPVFQLPEAFWPEPEDESSVNLRVSHLGGVGGTLVIHTAQDTDGKRYNAYINQDGVNGLGSAAKNLTSLEGVAFDHVAGESIPWDDDYWVNQYPWRVGADLTGGPFVKNVGGFIRFQGFYKRTPGETELPGYLFTLPSDYRTNQTVMIPIDLEDSWGQMTIFSNGDAYVHGNPPAAALGTSFENAWFSRTNSGNSALTLENGWVSGARQARAGLYGGVVRFQGTVKSGTNAVITTLPSSMRPNRTVYMVSAAVGGPAPARVYVTTDGKLRVDGVPLSVATLGVSLDGVSFGL